MKYHLCCNQVKYCWEVRDSKEAVIFSGSLKEAEQYINNLNGRENK